MINSIYILVLNLNVREKQGERRKMVLVNLPLVAQANQYHPSVCIITREVQYKKKKKNVQKTLFIPNGIVL